MYAVANSCAYCTITLLRKFINITHFTIALKNDKFLMWFYNAAKYLDHIFFEKFNILM